MKNTSLNTGLVTNAGVFRRSIKLERKKLMALFQMSVYGAKSAAEILVRVLGKIVRGNKNAPCL